MVLAAPKENQQMIRIEIKNSDSNPVFIAVYPTDVEQAERGLYMLHMWLVLEKTAKPLRCSKIK